MAEDDVTIQDLIEALSELAAGLPAGTKTPVEFGVCDGRSLQMLDNVDLHHYVAFREGVPYRVTVMFRGHMHPGEKVGKLLRGAMSDVDEELHDLTRGDDA